MISANSHTPSASSGHSSTFGVNLFEFTSFRKFLHYYQRARQAKEKSFNRSRFCKELGLPNTRSYFNDIVTGNRNLSKAYVERFIEILCMTSSEADYFRLLVYFEQSTYEQELAEVLGEKMSLKKWQKTAIYSELSKRVSPKSQRWLSMQKSSKDSSLSNHSDFEKSNAALKPTLKLNGEQKSIAGEEKKEKGTPSFSYSIPSSSGENQITEVTGALSKSEDAPLQETSLPKTSLLEALSSVADRIRSHFEESDSISELISQNETSLEA